MIPMRTSAWLWVATISILCVTSARGQEPDSTAPSTAVSDTMSPEERPLDDELEYRVLATARTSTLQKEINESADAGFRLQALIGGATAFGGAEIVAIMGRPLGNAADPRYQYKVLATNRTSTMQKELQEAGEAGYDYKAQTILETTFGGQEVVVVVERDRSEEDLLYDYKLLATQQTSTMQNELLEAGQAGFSVAGITVAETMRGGDEVVIITRRIRNEPAEE